MGALWIFAISVLALGCAPTQMVPVSIQPVPVTLFIDGELYPDGAPDQLELRADRPHLLFFKKQGYRAEQVLLRSIREEGGPRLEPDRVEVRLSPESSKRRELKIELDE